jgi:hypothetical protein
VHLDAKEIDGTHTRVIEELAMSATVERRGDHHGATALWSRFVQTKVKTKSPTPSSRRCHPS